MRPLSPLRVIRGFHEIPSWSRNEVAVRRLESPLYFVLMPYCEDRSYEATAMDSQFRFRYSAAIDIPIGSDQAGRQGQGLWADRPTILPPLGRLLLFFVRAVNRHFFATHSGSGAAAFRRPHNSTNLLRASHLDFFQHKPSTFIPKTSIPPLGTLS